MGGAVQVAVRFTDGSVIARTGWTNALPEFVRHPRFIECDETYLHDYATKDTDWNDEPGLIGPVDYGLVIFDLQTKTVLSRQGYTAFTNKTIFCDLDGQLWSHGGDDALDIFSYFLREGRVVVEKLTGKKIDGRVDPSTLTTEIIALPRDVKDYDAAIGPISEDINRRTPDFRHGYLKYDLSPWTIDHADWMSGHSAAEMRQKVEALGLVISPESERLWSEAEAKTR